MSMFKVKKHTDELECLYLFNLLTPPYIKQNCPDAFLTEKSFSQRETALLSVKVS